MQELQHFDETVGLFTDDFVASPCFANLMQGLYDMSLQETALPISQTNALADIVKDFFGIEITEIEGILLYLEAEVICYV